MTNVNVQDLSDTECSETVGGYLTCNQIVIMTGAALGGLAVGAFGTPGAAPAGAFLGGLAGSLVADMVCP